MSAYIPTAQDSHGAKCECSNCAGWESEPGSLAAEMDSLSADMQREACEESARMAALSKKRPLYYVTSACALPIHGRAGEPSPWDHMSRVTVAKYFEDEQVWRWLATQHWAWPEANGLPDGDAIVTPYHVVIRSGLDVRVTKASGLRSAMREIGLDESTFEIGDLPRVSDDSVRLAA